MRNLTRAAKGLIRELYNGAVLTATRTYPHDAKWSIKHGDAASRSVDTKLVEAIVAAGAGCAHEEKSPMPGVQAFSFTFDRKKAVEAVRQKRAPKVDPAQVDWTTGLMEPAKA